MNTKPMETLLQLNETVISMTFGAVQPPTATKATHVYLTNQRIVIETNERSSVVKWPFNTAAEVLTGIYSLSDIQSVIPDKYRLFGIIPTRNTAIIVTLNNTKQFTIITEHRDVFLNAINSAIASA